MRPKKEKRLLIQRFCREWLEWVEADAIEPHFYFNRSDGLCPLLGKWLRRQEFSNADCSDIAHQLFHELDKQHVPFNRGSFDRQDMPYYKTESEHGTMHENKLRLAWAKAYIQKEF